MSRRWPRLRGGRAAEREAAELWLAVHASELPVAMAAQCEPTQRGHRGHTYAVALAGADARDRADACDPVAWLIAGETIAAMASASCWHHVVLAEAMGAPGVSGWRGGSMAERSIERQRAHKRAATGAGQMSLGDDAWGWLV